MLQKSGILLQNNDSLDGMLSGFNDANINLILHDRSPFPTKDGGFVATELINFFDGTSLSNFLFSIIGKAFFPAEKEFDFMHLKPASRLSS